MSLPIVDRPGWRRCPRPAAAVLAVSLAGLCSAGLALPAGEAPKVLAEKTLSQDLQRSRDVRWLDADNVLLATPDRGAVALPLDSAHPNPQASKVLVPGGPDRRPGGVWLPSRLGISDRFLAVGSPAFEIGWGSRSPAKLTGRETFEEITDLDVYGNRLAVLGTRRAENGKIAVDGAIAWIGSLDRGLSDLRAVVKSVDGDGARSMDACSNFELGAVRFLPDGKLLVVPGAEPGAYLIDPSGKLLYTWQTEQLGLDARCDFDDDKRDLMSQSPEPRWAWINQFKTVDEILPLPQGPGLVMRSVSPAGTRWQLAVLRPGGAPAVQPIPLSSPSSMAHLRGDVHGSRVVWLMFEEGRPEKPLSIKPRLIVTEVPR
jgi:hypothetical protein